MPTVNIPASSFSTTGTMAAGSLTLTVADASGFAVNDYLVVEIGGESGAGARGTVGVGGTWPDLSYATTGTMNADNTKPSGQYAYVVATGDVYRYLSGVWTQEDPVTQYYTAKVIPRSLVARVTAKVTNVLTLDTPAVVAVTNASVYFNNYTLFLAHSADPDGTEIVWPAGNFAISDMCWVQGKSNFHVRGAGKDDTKLFFPKGISAVALIDFSGAGSGNQVSDICLQGNALSQGYMIGWAPGGDQTAAQYHRGVIFNSQTDGIIQDTKSIDVFQYGAGVSFCANSSIYRHDAVHTEGLLTYIQWQVGGADCTGGELTDCTVTSAKLTAGIEWFRSTDVSIENYVGVNASMSINTCDNWTISYPSVTVAPDSWVNNTAFHINNPMIIVSNAIGGMSIARGGTITGAELAVQGYVNADNDVTRGILIDDPVPGITIRGGSYTAPDYASPSTLPGPQGIIAGYTAGGGNTSVSCFTSYGVIEAGTPAVGRANIGVANGTISYCRAGSIYGSPGVVLLENGTTSDPLSVHCGGVLEDDNGITCFVDDLGVDCWVDDIGNTLCCGDSASITLCPITIWIPYYGMSPGPGVLDPYSTGLTGAWSMQRRLLASYAPSTFYGATGLEIDSIADQTGLSHPFTASTTARPETLTVGSLTVADFTPNDNSMQTGTAISAFITASDGFIVWVGIIDSFPGTFTRLVHDNLQEYMGILASPTVNVTAYNWDGGNRQASTTSATGAHVITWRHQGGSLYVSVDGAAEVSTTAGDTQVMIGLLELSDAGANGFDGKVAELYTWNVVPSLSDRNAIIAQAKILLGI